MLGKTEYCAISGLPNPARAGPAESAHQAAVTAATTTAIVAAAAAAATAAPAAATAAGATTIATAAVCNDTNISHNNCKDL